MWDGSLRSWTLYIQYEGFTHTTKYAKYQKTTNDCSLSILAVNLIFLQVHY